MTTLPNTGRTSWLDDASSAPQISQYAQRLDTFIGAMADGRIDDAELAAAEARLAALMRDVEPQLSDDLHAKITQLLCELTAYDVMQMVHSMNAARGQRKFVG